MNKDQIRENPITEFISRYRKWFIAGISLQLIPTIILVSAFIGGMAYHIINDDSNWHPYKSYIQNGYKTGVEDGDKDKDDLFDHPAEYLDATPWYQYKMETTRLKEQVVKEKDDYLKQFPEDERGIKRAELKTEGFKLPLEKTLKKRFKTGLDFYADYVDKKIKREAYKSDKEYRKALENEAWKVGYEYGYAKGRYFGKDLTEKL